MPDDEGLRELMAEQAWGVLVAAAKDGTTNWSVVAHAIVGNQLPVVERYAAERAAEALQGLIDETTHMGTTVVPTWRLLNVAAALAADGTEPRPAHRQDETEAGRG